MLVTIIIFLIAIISLFGIMMFRAWEMKKVETKNTLPTRKIIPEIHFRHVERIMLYLAKHIIQSIVLIIVKYYFIFSARIKRWAGMNWPKVYNFFRKNKEIDTELKPSTFFQKAVRESKAKIRRIKENVKKEHEEKIAETEKEVENDVVVEEVKEEEKV